jgi:ribosome-binding ATPase YchF (GTP1/OBG family)
VSRAGAAASLRWSDIFRISFADLTAAGGETEAKRAGKQRLELKTYVMQDYDVVNFRFNK